MPDFYKKITDMHGGLEQVVRKVPGFRGYFARQDRRAADRLLREKLVLGFSEQLNEFNRVQRLLVEAGGLNNMDRVRAVDSKLRLFLDRVQSAPSGYAGMFDSLKVDEVALERVYAFDSALLIYLDQLASGLRRLEEVVGSVSVGDVLNELDILAGEVSATFSHRSEAMHGLQDS